jgi:2-methylisocitrate lyase-like PEP mutase family enzyme
MAVDARTQDKARRLRSLYRDAVLVLPNAWDAGSAAVIAAAGAPAIATTSGGVAWSLGRSDGQRLERDEMIAAVGRIVSAVDVPVTADVEAGYGPDPANVASTVAAVIGVGAVGINLEDSRGGGGPLFSIEQQAARIRAAREAAAEAGLPELVVNARTDVVLFQIGAPEGRLDEVLARASAYAAAGADSVFVPGLLDLDALRTLAERSPVPVNAMAVPGGPAVADLAAAGVRRISLGTTVAQAAYSAAREAARELLGEGTYGALDGVLGYADLNALFSGDR